VRGDFKKKTALTLRGQKIFVHTGDEVAGKRHSRQKEEQGQSQGRWMYMGLFADSSVPVRLD
jgi:hypothetical protein